MKKFLWATSIATLLFLPTNVQAGSIAVEASLAGGGPAVNGTNLVDIRIRYEPSDVDQYFGGVAFGLEFGGGVSASSGWIGSNDFFQDANSDFKQHWNKNTDSSGNLSDILVLAEDVVSKNRQYGVEGRPTDDRTFPPASGGDLGWPTLIGQVEVNWDGLDGFVRVVTGSDPSWTTFVDNGGGSFTALTETNPLQGNQLNFSSVAPADPTASISGTGTGDATLDYSGSANTGLSFDGNGTTFEITNLPGGDLALFLELDGVSDLGTLASDLTGGGVTASTDASNPFLPGANLSIIFAGDFSGTQFVTLADLGDGVTITGAAVPEPSTFVLTGLALVGMFGCGWRRRRSS